MIYDGIKGTVRLQIMQDKGPLNPRTDQDNLGTMVCWHSRYALGDQRPGGDPSTWYLENVTDEMVCLNLYLYDHSGISMSCEPFVGRAPHAEWDSGQVGFIVADCKRMGISPETVLRAEVEEYDQYLQGNILRFTVLKLCPTCKQWEEVEDCGGFYSVEDLLDALDPDDRELFEEEVRHAV